MEKKPSVVAIAVAVVFSIILFPLILVTGIGAGGMFSAASLLQPERTDDIYQSFVDNGGVDSIYELLLEGMEEGAGEDMKELDFSFEEFFPKEQIETMVHDFYYAFVQGKSYTIDLSHQKEMLWDFVMDTFDENIEATLREEYGEAFDEMVESKKQELILEAKEIYMEDMTELLEKEFASIEDEITFEITSIYEMAEYEEIKELEEKIGYSLSDRTELCRVINFAGYIMLGITGFLLLLLLICHLFRPSGFFTAGAFALVDGGILLLLSKGVKNVLLNLLNAEIAEQELATEEFPEFITNMISDVFGWVLEGFEKVGMIGIITAVILILVGVLLLVIRKNKAEAEPISFMEAQ